jgi:heptosyltransferase II
VKILIEIPAWIGDAVMATPTIENIIKHYAGSEISIIGSTKAVDLFKYHPNIIRVIVFNKQYFSMLKTSRKIGQFDYYFSLRNSIRSKVFKYLISSKKKYQFDGGSKNNLHLVEKYNNFLNKSININLLAGNLKINNKDFQTLTKTKPLLGINPGASYGSAKRWNSLEYARLAKNLSKYFDIIIFGGDSEKNVALEIETFLIKKEVTNYQNFAGHTNLSELIFYISSLDLFITGDSGPMHIAASYQIPTISIFGPTRDYETAPWLNKNNIIIKKNLSCQPCMQRVCPLGHHNCMNLIKAEDVLIAVDSLKLNAINKRLIN